jgi:predicted transcriptional regulator
MQAKPDPTVVATSVRLPKPLVEQVDAIAKAERRSRNFVIEQLVDEALKARQ